MTLADPVAEARRLVETAGLPLRALGGVGVALRCPSFERYPRPLGDLDLATTRDAGEAVADLLVRAGYLPDDAFNLVNYERRLRFADPARERLVDVFVGDFEMTHRVPLEGRLELEPLTIPVADLVLTKLQVGEPAYQDVHGLALLLLDHPLDGDRVGAVVGREFGFYRHAQALLALLRARLGELGLAGPDAQAVLGRAEEVAEALELAPKSHRFRLRAALARS